MFGRIISTTAALCLGGILMLPAPTTAQENAMSTQPSPRITVTGEGEVSVAPDMAVLGMTVLREAKTAREALNANNGAMEKALSAMKEAGIAERDLQTFGLSIRPRYQQPSKDSAVTERRIVGYTVTNTLTARVRELATVGELLDKAVTLGVNQGGDLRFVNADTKPILTEARKLAVADALGRARTLTEAADVKLGRILDITEQSFQPRPIPIARQTMAASAAPESVPVAAGENSYRTTVSMVFELEP